MATAAQIKALLQSHGNGDEERFYATALQVAAAEARRGHEDLAQEIKRLVDDAKKKRNTPKASPSIFHVAQPLGEAAELLEETDLGWKVEDLILPPILMDRVSIGTEGQSRIYDVERKKDRQTRLESTREATYFETEISFPLT